MRPSASKRSPDLFGDERVDELVSTVSFAATFFYALGGAAIFVYRRRDPAAPWTMPGYPWVPALYVGASVIFTLAIAIDAPRDAMKGLVILAAGVGAYLWGERSRRRRALS
jgi:APA family basic amino acid/polyamine antiporter